MSFFGYMKGIYVLLNDEIRPNVGLVRIDRVYMLIGNWSTYIDEALHSRQLMWYNGRVQTRL